MSQSENIEKYPCAKRAMAALLIALKEDGLPAAGIVLCVSPMGEGGARLFTALHDDAQPTLAGQRVGSPLTALLEQAMVVIKNHSQTKGD